jgi:arylsulfatase A-like enzyme
MRVGRGSVGFSVGLLAVGLQDLDGAVAHFERAIEVEENAGMRLALVLSRAGLAGTLGRRQGPGDAERARELFDRACADSGDLGLGESNGSGGGEGFTGAVSVDLPDLIRDDWAEVLIEARTSSAAWMVPGFNLGQRPHPEQDGRPLSYLYEGEGTMLIRDGRPHTYRIRADWSKPSFGEWRGPWRQLVLEVWAPNPADFDIISVQIVSKAARFAESGAGERSVVRGRDRRRALYLHAPGKLEYSVTVPEGGRIDAGLSVLQSTRPIEFRVSASDGGTPRTLFEQTISETERWVPATVDLADYAGRAVTLTLEARSDDAGSVALWGAPTLSGSARDPARPNVIFYIIDGGGADLMSVHGYNRRTTPNLERLAQHGVVFDHAFSNSAWTKPSTASFMTSLYQSVLGGFPSLHDPIPARAPTMAERFHDAGYQTSVFTSNPWAGSFSNLERGADVFRDHGAEHHSSSSVELQEAFWRWREEYPGQPYWVHFQTTDVHEPHEPVAPFAGMFVGPERRARFFEHWRKTNFWEADLALSLEYMKNPQNTLSALYRTRLIEMGADPTEFFDTQRGLYDETMAHQDHQLGKLVRELKASGEWENTLLVVASDHGHPAGSFSRFGRELFDPVPPDSEGALLDSYRTHIPMLFVWPGHLPEGVRIRETVSMIDMLPTLLDLAGLPLPEIVQGQSLVPLMRGTDGWEPRPVFIEQLQPVPTHQTLVGHIEIIDGRWGASLEIWPEELEGDDTVRPVGNQRAARPHRADIPDLLLYDLRSDPFATRNVNEAHPELVEQYRRVLTERWEAHQMLSGHFEGGGEMALSPDQLETLRDLGYVR